MNRMVKVIIANKDGDALDEIKIPVDPDTDDRFTAKSELEVQKVLRDLVENRWEVDDAG